MPELTTQQQAAVPVILAISGWGRNRTEAFVAELLDEEAAAIAAASHIDKEVNQAFISARQDLLNQIMDRVQARRKANDHPLT